jgi:hypothetical protein
MMRHDELKAKQQELVSKTQKLIERMHELTGELPEAAEELRAKLLDERGRLQMGVGAFADEYAELERLWTLAYLPYLKAEAEAADARAGELAKQEKELVDKFASIMQQIEAIDTPENRNALGEVRMREKLDPLHAEKNKIDRQELRPLREKLELTRNDARARRYAAVKLGTTLDASEADWQKAAHLAGERARKATRDFVNR